METDDVTDSQLMEIDIPEEEMELWEEDNMETDDILCQALDEEMERQRKQDMYGGGPTHTQPAQTFQTSTPHVHAPQPVHAQLAEAAPQPAPAPPQPAHVPPQAAQASQVQTPPQPAQAPQPALAQQPPAQLAALNDTARRVTFHPQNQLDILQSMNELEPQIVNLLQHELTQHHGIKWYMALTAEYSKLNLDGDQITTEQVFRSDTVIATNQGDITDTLATAMQDIYRRSQEFQAEGSGWTLERVISLTVHTVLYQPLLGNSYIKLPKYIMKKRAVLNIQNDDDKCILWAILAHLHPVHYRDHPHRVGKYHHYEHELNMIGVSYPTPLADITKIEKNNNISINVIGFDETDKFYPLRVAKDIKEQHVNLLLIKEGEKGHYCLIRNFSALMNKRTKAKRKHYFCYNCLHGFTKQSLLDNHVQLCYKQRAQKIVFPEKEKTVKFKNIKKQLRVPFIIYADFECYTEKIANPVNNPNKTNTTAYQHHKPSGFSYMVVSARQDYTKAPVVYRGRNVVDTFFSYIIDEEQRIKDILKNPQPMRLTREEEQEFYQADDCHICNQPLGIDRVRDHDHLTGDYRGAAHNECNLALKYKKVNDKLVFSFVVPVVFHNLRGYDAHVLMESLGKYKKRRLSCIPNNSERYISFSLGTLRFIDSFQFLGTSLEKLVNNLAAEGKDKFKLLTRYIVDTTKQDLLLRKGVYPYDYVDSPAKLMETALPQQVEFYSILNQETISDEDYTHAKDVWRVFRCRTMGDYHDVYLKSDVLLLADVFESFRDMAMETYKLDPAHYFTAPGFSWDSMLKYTGVELDLLNDPDMYLMVESGIRGGVSMITKKFAKANNPYVDDYNPAKPINYLMYLDANNLYGWAMSQKLPEKEFEWMTEQSLQNFDVTQISDTAETGYILEVDLEYPAEIHDLHSDLPVAPEQRKVPDDELSPYSAELKDRLQLTGKPHSKLIPNLYNKTRYVIHYINLKQYMGLGVRLLRIHRGIQFYQSYWLKKYINLNTEKRKQARNTFEKDFFKLLNNSIFGKTMENVRGRTNMELVHTEKRLKRVTSKPNFHRVHIFNKDLVAAHCLSTKIELNKPIYVGFAILDISKTLMYDFHYGYIKTKYGDNAQLCFTDTDSLLYDIKTKDIYHDMADDADKFDTSDYPTDHLLHSIVNKKVIGKMKDETAGVPIKEFVGLRSKMYSMTYGHGFEKKTAKGIKKSTIRQKLRHAMYKDALFQEIVTQATMRVIRSLSHQLYSMVCNKKALSPYDDKRYVLDDKFTTRAHGHVDNMHQE